MYINSDAQTQCFEYCGLNRTGRIFNKSFLIFLLLKFSYNKVYFVSNLQNQVSRIYAKSNLLKKKHEKNLISRIRKKWLLAKKPFFRP